MSISKTTGQRKVEAILIHGDKFYDYSLWPTKVTAKCYVNTICPKHGVWRHLIKTHVNNKTGCIKCGDEYRSGVLTKGRRYYVKKATESHRDKYDYSLWPDGINGRSKVTTICAVHGKWSHQVQRHMYGGSSCPKCNKSYKRTTDEWKAECGNIHNFKYDYSLWPSEVKAKTIVDSICPKHGGWSHNLDNHMRGNGCPYCRKTGYNAGLVGFLYVLKKDRENFKIGISNNPERRIKRLTKVTPFCFSTIAIYKHNDGNVIKQLESYLHKFFKSSGFSGFDGATEWVKVHDHDIFIVTELLGCVPYYTKLIHTSHDNDTIRCSLH